MYEIIIKTNNTKVIYIKMIKKIAYVITSYIIYKLKLNILLICVMYKYKYQRSFISRLILKIHQYNIRALFGTRHDKK